MQSLVGTRTAADINLAAQLLILAGLLVGFALARRKRFDQHANVQTAMVLLNLALIALVMAVSFYDYVIAGGSTTGTVAQLMIGHAALGIVVEGVALYLILRMRTKLIPPGLRVGNIKLWMRATLALWTLLVLLGIGIYAQRYLLQRAVASAPLLEMRQLSADLYVHAVELDDAQSRQSLTAVKRHAEHLVNLIEGKRRPPLWRQRHRRPSGRPGRQRWAARPPRGCRHRGRGPGRHRRGRRGARSSSIASSPSPSSCSARQAWRGPRPGLPRSWSWPASANGEGVFDIDVAARAAGVVEAPSVAFATETAGGQVTVTVQEDNFTFIPSQLTIPAGTTVVWVNEERAKHTATADDGLFDSGDQELGVSYAYTFSEPGIYPYYCRYHGDIDGIGMAGTIVVE